MTYDDEEILCRIHSLPEVLSDIIYEYLPLKVKMFLSKELYIKHHNVFFSCVKRLKHEEYVRAMIRQDNDFVFRYIFNENVKRWKCLKNYYHKNCIYDNYIAFAESYCVDNVSSKCLMVIREYYGYAKNEHRKKTIKYKYIEWN